MLPAGKHKNLMRIIFVTFSIVALYLSDYSAVAQDIIRNSSTVSVCYAGNKVNRIYIPPPKDFYSKKGSNGATITVNYYGFPDAPKTAVQYAVSILSSLLPKDARFTLNATWKQLTNTSTLGTTGVPFYVRGYVINALNPSVYYPVSLAEKISEQSLNDDNEGDIELTLNSRISWYTGIDGNTPASGYDLVTVVLHELCHGIGIYDSFSVTNTTGSYGFYSIPLIYDTFIENSGGVNLTDTDSISNNSRNLYDQLTGNRIYFNGPLIRTFTGGGRPKIFAPSTWDPGSSISHLDEDLTQQVNALMTPFLDKGEAIHNPGDLTLSILGDLGWINTRIIHKQFHDTEENPGEIAFTAKINSDTLFYRDSVGLVYSFNSFATSDTLYFIPPQADDSFRINLSIPSYNTPVSYYLFVKDCFNRIYSLPSEGIESPYRFFIGTDTVKPIITHRPLDYYFDKTPSVKFKASAHDNIGIDTVYIEFIKNNEAVKYLGLSNDSLDIYSTVLDLKAEMIAANDSIQYRIVAIDKTLSHNIRTLPDSGYYTIHFESTLSVVDSYSTDFNDAENDFVTRGFSITQPSNFTNLALHTKHPYESPDKDGDSLEYTAVIKHPVIVDETGILINFREIVLIEPGEAGSVFGSSDFYDYVIVEGSKDFGKSWFGLGPGYDSRISSVFLYDYNLSMDGQNSTYTGNQNMYIGHSIDIRTFKSFAKGDSLMIRFRLYSDPYAHGWGWAIDDLSIKSVAATVPYLYSSDFNIYPNPGNGHIKIDPGETSFRLPVTYYVLNSAGIKMTEGKVNPDAESSIDISIFPSGIYIIVLKTDNRIRAVKYSLIKE